MSSRRRAVRLGILALGAAGWFALAAARGGYLDPGPTIRRRPLTPGGITVLDGDTFRAEGVTYRLLGADTPERAAPWFDGDQEPWASRAARRVRRALAGARRVTLVTRREADARGRRLAHLVLDGEPLAALLVREGLAYSTIGRFGDGGFPAEATQVAVAAAARAAAPPFEPPWRWRRRHRVEPP